MPAASSQRGDEVGVDRAAAQQRWRGEGQSAVGAADAHEPGRALLHDVVVGRLAAGRSQAWQVPSVGWPANGSSRLGVKMRTR